MEEKALAKIAEEAKENGDNNLAIVLYVYLGSKKAGTDGFFVEHCQDFARSGTEWIKTRERIERIKNRRN